jgi:gamma-glutamylputrescine oxidase
MTALFRNDRPGEHAPSWYAASLPPAICPNAAPLRGDVTADVAILGAGFTGLWAALTLARAGRSVVVLDAHRVGFGASGRNGGQVNPGFNQSQQKLEAQLGEARARALWDLAEEARRQLRDFCATHAPEAAYRPGSAFAEYAGAVAELEAEAEFLDQALRLRVGGDGPQRLRRPCEIAALRGWRPRSGRRASAPSGLCPRAGAGGRGGGCHHP